MFDHGFFFFGSHVHEKSLRPEAFFNIEYRMINSASVAEDRLYPSKFNSQYSLLIIPLRFIHKRIPVIHRRVIGFFDGAGT